MLALLPSYRWMNWRQSGQSYTAIKRQSQALETLVTTALLSFRPVHIPWVNSLSFLWFLIPSCCWTTICSLVICLEIARAAVFKIWLEDHFRDGGWGGVYKVRNTLIITLRQCCHRGSGVTQRQHDISQQIEWRSICENPAVFYEAEDLQKSNTTPFFFLNYFFRDF